MTNDRRMSALPPKADKEQTCRNVRFVPAPDLTHRNKRGARGCNDLRSGRTPVISLNGTLWNVSTTGSGWLEPNVCRSNHLAPLLGFVGDELAEIGGREREHVAT